ncbi:MAG: DUF3788 family protein [Anaerolineae bacterium]|nr:DUF3788 family protein [Anaerolineae bacterium]
MQTLMSIGSFADKQDQPTEAEILAAVGSLLSEWEALTAFIREHYRTQADIKFMYGKNYGWALRFRSKGRLLTALYPTEGGFTVQIILPPDAIEQAQAMNLGERVAQAIARATPYPEGRWLFIPVESAADAEDIRRLLALRAEALRRST